MNIFEAIETGDITAVIAVVDPALKEAAREASERAHAKGLEVADGRVGDGSKAHGTLARSSKQGGDPSDES